MQTLTLSPSKSSHLFPRHLYLVLLSHPFSASSAASDPLPTRRRRTEAATSTPRRSYQHHYDEESKSVKVSVWWDFENCSVPAAVNVYRVAPRIVSALRSNGIRGPVSINAFGDIVQLARATQEALVSTGICLTHVPHSGKNSSDRSFMADLISWTAQNPPPAHFFLISSDKDFATILHRLRMNNYNIILSSNDCASGALCSAATVMLPWGPLVRGEDFSAKYFNYPPDGLFGSWYGHYKGPLDDPFAGSEQIPYSQHEESMEHINETKPRPIPKSVVNNILQIINNHPRGIALSTLRDELKRKTFLQKDLYGYRKFSHLISSLSNVLTLLPPPHGESQPYVYARKKRVDPFEKKPDPKGSIEPVVELTVEPVEESFKSGTETENQVSNKGILGIFRKIFFGQEVGEKEDAVPIVVKSEEEEKGSSLVSNPKVELKQKDDLGINNNDDNNNNKGFFKWITTWLRFGREKDKNHVLLAESEFWETLKLFLTSPKGSDLIAKSQTREELKRALQKEGPLALKDLKETHFTQLINLLISEKKWIQERTNSFILSIPSNDLSPQIAPNEITKQEKTHKKPPNRDEIISNCHKLVNEMIDHNPNGFNMSLFKPEFEKKFGYTLDYKNLRYPKLVSLLEILPGIKVDLYSNRIYKNDGKKARTNGSVTNGEDSSVFDELGPVSEEGVYDKPSLSEEELSDEELEIELDQENKNESSPLVQILDSWYGSKEKGFKEKSQGIDGLVDCSRRYNKNKNNNDNDNVNNNNSHEKIVDLGIKEKKGRVLRREKSRYSFVSDESGEDEEKKLVESILGGLKKAGESRAAAAAGKGF